MVTVAAAIAAAACAMGAAAVWCFRTKRAAVVDAAWGAAFVLVAATTAAVAAVRSDDAGSQIRRWVLVGLVTIWGGRLSWHLWRRTHEVAHDDPRYEQLLGGAVGEVPVARVLTKVFAVQGIAIALISAPIVVGVTLRVRVWPLVFVGCVVWSLGMAFEAVADAQLAAYKARAERSPVLDTGLWGWSRHPNYFGDATVWWGIWLVGAAGSGPAAAFSTIMSPVLMTWFLTAVSGVRLAERRMAGRPGWDEYCARTPVFFPRPPRR